MIGFKLIDGDLSITNNEIDMVAGSELVSQTITTVLSTNKGEWLFNEKEGIDFYAILGKQQVKTKSAKESFYQREVINIRQNDDALAEKLRKRLNGE